MELDLFKFITDNSVEAHWTHENKQCLIWIPYNILDEFVGEFSYFFETEGEAVGYLQHTRICIDLVALGMDDEIELARVIPKEEK